MTDTSPTKKVDRVLSGKVVSTANEKTAIVAVHAMKTHPKYKKRYGSTARYKIHDPKNEAELGDMVTFKACRPISKDKRWIFVSKTAA